MYWFVVSLFLLIGQSLQAEITQADFIITFKKLDELNTILQEKRSITSKEKEVYGINYAILIERLKETIPQLKNDIDTLRANIKKFNIIPIQSPPVPTDLPPLLPGSNSSPKTTVTELKREMEVYKYKIKVIKDFLELLQREYIPDTEKAMKGTKKGMNDTNLKDVFREVAKYAYKHYKAEYDLFKLKEQEALGELKELEDEIAILKRRIKK
jgi:hypothetical protein